MKPDVLEQMVKLEEIRRKHAESMIANGGGGQIMIQQGDKNVALNNQQIINIMNQQKEALQKQGEQLQQIKQAYEKLARENMDLKNQLQSNNNTITELQNLNTQLLTKLSEQKQ